MERSTLGKLTNRQKQAAATKQKIYDAALALFAHSSYEGVTVRDICAKAGVSVGIFYHYYPSKENILNEGFGYDQFDDFIKERCLAHEREAPVENIRFLIRLQLETTKKAGYQMLVFFYKHQLDNNEEKYELEEKRFFFHRILSEVELAVAEGALFGDPVVIAEDIMHNSRGVIYNWCINAGKNDLLDTGERFLQMVLDYYGKKPEDRRH